MFQIDGLAVGKIDEQKNKLMEIRDGASSQRF